MLSERMRTIVQEELGLAGSLRERRAEEDEDEGTFSVQRRHV